jgi:putative ABC transport system permease protein
MLENVTADVKYALRRLRSRPTYTLLTVLTLALGVAGVAAVFGITNRLLLEPLPLRAEDEVAVFWARGDWSAAEFLHVRPDMGDFRGVAAYRSEDLTLHTGDGPARLLEGISASAELFDVLGVGPLLGSGFRPGDDRPGTERVAVLSHSLWRELGGDPGIVGRRIEFGGVLRTVAGVMPEGFWFPSPTVRLWLSEPLDPEAEAGVYTLVARAAPGIAPAAMHGQMQRITAMLGERFDYPEQWDKTQNVHLTPVRDFLLGPVRPAVLALLAAMAVILLVACVNVAALMLGQVDSRGTEMAVRAALGAGRKRILGQVVVESLVTGVLAGAVGAVLALAGFRFLAGALPLGSLADTVAVDWTVFAAAMAAALAAATAVALVPGASIVRSDPQTRLTGSRTAGVAGRGGRLEAALVVAQVALVVLLAAGAGLLIRTVVNLRAIDPGVDPRGVGVVDVVMPATGEHARTPRLVGEMVEAVRGLPGVESVAAVQRLPLRGSGDTWGIRIEAQPDLEGATTFGRIVTPDYFQAMRIRFASGRGFLETDRVPPGTDGAVVINQALADRFFPGIDPLGQRIGAGESWNGVVGVVENVAEAELRDAPAPARYLLYDQFDSVRPEHSIVLRMRGDADPASVLDAARQAVHAAAPGVAVRELTTMENVFARAMGPVREVMALLTLLGGLALALGTIGVYGVASHLVTRRRRDWGIRIALGLRPARVVGQVVGRGGALVGAGIVLGVAGFLALARVLGGFLYGVGTADPVTLAGAAAVLMGTGLIAAWLPARRASRIDPAVVLREQ